MDIVDSVLAPKGRENIAQGNALGKGFIVVFQALKGREKLLLISHDLYWLGMIRFVSRPVGA